ncbi:MAG: hypothetical protein IPJ16_06640 [Bacteroidales bacterium]|nr:hypothetical protein [Bacteroidales bacterium]
MKKNLLIIQFLSILLLTGCSSKQESFTVNFTGKTSETKWSVSQLNQEIPADWSSSEFLTFELKSSTTQRFDLKVYDTSGVRRVTIQPFQGAWVRASIPLIHFQKRNTKGMDMAAIGKTARPGYWIGFSSQVGSINNVDSIGVSMRLPIGNPNLEIRNVQLTMSAMDTVFGPYPLVDEFGQWIPAEWDGKAKSVEELQEAWNEEAKTLKTGNFNLSVYGGFKAQKLKGTGFFRVEKIDSIWWFVDPDGYLFYSTGTTGIGPRSEFSRIKGREYIFRSFPPAAELTMPTQTANQPANRPANQPTATNYSFYSWNLYRRFGSEWYQKWMNFTFRRMDDWGLNTIANWSDANLGNQQKKAYVATLRGWGIETGLMGMPDVYDPAWVKSVDEAAQRQCAPKKDDPWLLGYFIGNEPPWPNRELELVNVILTGESTPMQTELKKFLEKEDTPERRKEFIYNTYAKFISTINAALKKHDPNHLNLGLRFGGSAPDAIIIASKGFDVFSFNSYGYSVNPAMIKRIYEITGLPMVIGEFHFGVPGRGLAPGLAQTISQEERGVAYRYYVENAAANHAIIGTHWFQWMDQPATGRNDGENYNIGFVDVTDRPYTELINAAKDTFGRILSVHSGKEPPVTRQALTQ